MEQKGHCVHCRTAIDVPASYADGDHIKCGACGTQHRVLRGTGNVRLVISDVGPLKEELQAHQHRIAKLENELYAARGSFGLGANGLGLGVIYILVQVGWEEQMLSRQLLINAALIAVASGMALEIANFLFLAKRRLMNQLSAEIATMRAEARDLQRKIREGTLRR